MTAIPFPLSTSPGLRSQEAAGRLINCYAEPIGKPVPTDKHGRLAVWHRAAGLTNFATSSQTGVRGGILVAGTLYVGFSGKLYKCSSSGGAMSLVGDLTGTKKGFFAQNNAATPDKVFVDPDGNIATFTPSAVTNSFDADLPAPCDVCSIDGYFVFPIGDGRCFTSDLNATTVTQLAFGKAESKPDGLVRAIPFSGDLLLFGNSTTEIWVDSATIPFPFARQVVMPRGIAGPYCVAGHEDGFGRALIWVGDDNGVYQLNGLNPSKISPPDLDARIEAVTDKTKLEACVYIERGHGFWQLSSDDWTWVFNLNTQKWHERDSYGLSRSRISTTFNAFGKWLCGDTKTGNIQQITNSVYQEVGDPFRMRIESGAVVKFPHRILVPRADFDFTLGVGDAAGLDPIQTDPSVEISYSLDGGLNWSIPSIRKLGRQSDGRYGVSTSRNGVSNAQGHRWRLDVADPVHVGFMGGDQLATLRAA